MTKSRIGILAEEISALFAKAQASHKSSIILDLLMQGGRIYQPTIPAEDWRSQPEIMSLLLYCAGYKEETIGSFSSPSTSRGISQQAVSKRLIKAALLMDERFGGDLADLRERRNKVKLLFKTHFDAAHNLPNYEGACANVHGHRWLVDIELEGEVNPETGMVMDFKILKRLINPLLPDHSQVNEIVANPTAENIAGFLFNKITKALASAEVRARLLSLTVWETPETGAKYP